MRSHTTTVANWKPQIGSRWSRRQSKLYTRTTSDSGRLALFVKRSYLNMVYADAEAVLSHEDVSVLKVNELFNWFKAWEFMERCGFADADDDDGSGGDDEE